MTILDKFIESMQWSDDATEHEKTLVLGNLRGLSVMYDGEIQRVRECIREAQEAFMTGHNTKAFRKMEEALRRKDDDE